MNRHFLRGMLWAAGFPLAGALIGLAVAQTVVVAPTGQPVLNQGRQARALTKSDTVFIQPTRYIYIGDAAACTIAVVFVGDSAAVTLATAQPGRVLPLSIIKLMSTNTTCTAVTALY